MGVLFILGNYVCLVIVWFINLNNLDLCNSLIGMIVVVSLIN